MSFLNAPSSPPLSAFPSVTRMHETNKQPMIQQINILKQPRSFIIHLRRISQSTRVDFGEKKNPQDTPILQLNQSAVMQRGDMHAPLESPHKSYYYPHYLHYPRITMTGSSSLTVTTRNPYPRTATPLSLTGQAHSPLESSHRNHYLVHPSIITTTSRLRKDPSPPKGHHAIPLFFFIAF